MIRLTQILIFALCLCAGVAFAQADGEEFSPTDTPGIVDLYPASFARIDGLLRDFDRPSKQSFALEVGPKLVELKATYWEKSRQENLSIDGLSNSDTSLWGRYFNLFATSSWFEGKLVGESELAYSALGFASFTEQLPIMRRMGVSGRWGKAGYGFAYRTFGQGFISLAGAKVEHDREESQLWAEYDFGLFRLRGAAGESWEKNSVTHDLTLTKTAGASFHVAQPQWSASFSSSYSSIGHGKEWDNKTFAFANGLSLVYRPATPFTVEPTFNLRHEWDPATQLKTDTPSAGLALAYRPFRDLQLVGRASYARDLSDDPLKDASIMSTAAGLNLKLGTSFLGEHSMSLQFEYKNESRPTLPDNQHASLIGTVQFRVAGF